MADRGPDARGTFTLPWLMLGQTRLAIIDLDSRSNQPFQSHDGRHVLVYNGEIYNYVELRAELVGEHGWSFRTASDTEVVLAALIQWGVNALNKFNGMFALCFVDTQTHSGLLARDRFGVKPLYWTRDNGAMAFASGTRALECLRSRAAEPNLRHLTGYLRSSFTNFDSSSFLEEISELEPGHYMLFSRSSLELQRYWPVSTGRVVEQDSLSNVADLLRSAVELRLRSDVPIAVTLSGGLDSSIVAALAAQSGVKVTAFTADTIGHQGNEAGRAASFCSRLGLEHHAIPIDQRLRLDRTEELIAASDGPLASPSAVALDQIMIAVREKGYRVVLEGQGADEVFGGYIEQLVPRVCRSLILRGRPREALHVWREMSAVHGFGWSAKASVRELIPLSHALYTRYEGIGQALGPGLRATEKDTAVPIRTVPMSAEDVRDFQLRIGLRGLLTYGDRISMASSLESRQPFLDYRLVECLATWDPWDKLGSGRGKRLLRQAARDILQDQQPVSAAKLGFVMPVQQWMMEREVGKRLLGGRCVREGLYDGPGVARLLRRNEGRGSANVALACFRLLMGELWYAQFRA